MRQRATTEGHLSFDIGYPKAYNRQHGYTGGALMVHGDCVAPGCFAMTDPVIEEIYTLADAAFRNGQRYFRVHIFPFRVTEKNMRMHIKPKWIKYWWNLKEGYDLFERTHQPPNVEVRNGLYVFEQ